MDTIITFLEQYWGYTVCGGISLGTIITTIIVLIKTVLKDKHKDTLLDDAVNHANSLCDELNKHNENYEKEREELKNFITTQQLEFSNIIVNVQDSANRKINALQAALTKKQNDLITQQKGIAAKEEYFAQVQATTFQAISYLVLASKLPTEDKVVLQEKFNKLATHDASKYKQISVDNFTANFTDITDIKFSNLPDHLDDSDSSIDASVSIQNTIEETKSLLDKYTKEG